MNKPKPEGPKSKALDDDLVMSLVELALSRPPEERERYLQSACARDTALLEEVRKYVDAEVRLKGFLLDPLFPPATIEHPFEPGDLLDGRFRIVREVAEGGMGIVYEAIDERLERTVALKCAKPGFRKRLPPEVRHATGISHPNICKIFEIHSAASKQGEIDFLTMEFLEGETLTERLRHGPIPEPEARAIAAQLCAGLAEAHRNHIIHGDLKSNNVILTAARDGSPRAVITDFGLASQPANTARAMQSGALGGTPEYMAPELWKGEKPSVVSDVYALGVILYEMVSGRKPFPLSEDSWDEGLKRKPHPVSPKWDRVLARCLHPDPVHRLRNAQQVAEALAPRSRRWVVATAAAVVLAGITGVATYRSTMVRPETVRLAILPFAGSPADGALSEGLLDQTQERLRRVRGTRSRHLTVIPLDAAVQNRLDRPEKAARLLGATHVLWGSMRRDENGRTFIHAWLTDASTKVPLQEWQASYQSNELHDAPIALSGLVTGTLRLPPVTVAPGVNAAAFGDYTKAAGLIARDLTEQAIPLLENAAKADPDAPLIYAKLAEAEGIQYESTKDVTWLAQAIQSLNEARQRNPDLAGFWSASGLIHQFQGLYEAAESDFHRALELDPQSGDDLRNLAYAYGKTSRYADAQLEYQKAIALQPGYFKNYYNLCGLLSEEANFNEAIQQCTTAISLAPNFSESYYRRAIAYFNLGRNPQAAEDFQHVLRLQPGSFKATVGLGNLRYAEARYSDAAAMYQHALKAAPETHVLYLDLAQALRLANRSAESKRAYRKGVALAEKELAKNSRDVPAEAHLAYMLARLSDKRQAESYAVLAMQTTPVSTEVGRYVLLTYEVLGERDRAISAAEAMPDDVLRSLARLSGLAELRGNSRFQQLMKSRHIQ